MELELLTLLKGIPVLVGTAAASSNYFMNRLIDENNRT